MANRLTATEWILNQYAKNSILSLNDFREASRMEKEEIIDAYLMGVSDEGRKTIHTEANAEEYFKGTYGS
jgi:hypothetical protein